MQGPIIYKSSAGSGKTYTLVTEYLKLVIPEPSLYKNILAITFTNKATDEMKSRIVQALARLANMPPEKMAEDYQYQLLTAHLEAEKKGYLKVHKQARKALTSILNDYGNFSVSTIESFMQRVIRAFTRELNIQLGYEIEMNQEVVLESVVDAVFMEISPNDKDALTKLFQGFVDRRLEEEKSWHIEMDVKQLGREIFQEKFQELAVQEEEDVEKIEKTLSFDKQLWAIRKNFENRMQEIGREALALIHRFNLSIDDFSRKKSGPAGYITRLAEQVPPDKYIPNAYAYGAYEDEEKWSTKTSKRKPEILAAVANGLGDLLAEAIHHYEASWISYQSALQVLRTLHSFGLIHELEKQLKQYRKENNQLIISDTNFLLGNIIRGQDAPFIFEKVGTRYKYYLLDEFQDTSTMQWNNLYPLVGDALAQGTGALLVGDIKQSIYRWRNGNMRLLMDIVEAQLKLMGQQVHLEHLQNNWRTAGAIVDFNNQFFEIGATLLGNTIEHPEAALLFQKAYEEVAQTPQKTKIEGYVSIDTFPHRTFRDPPEVPSWEELAQQRCKAIIEDLKQDGFHGKDIMLLVRRNREGIRLAEYLQREGIKVASAESLLIGNHPSVLFLLTILKHLKDEKDPLAIAAMHHYYAKVILGKDSIHQSFANRQELAPEFDKLIPIWRKLPVYECIEHLLRQFPKLTAEPDAYLQGFIDAVLQYTNTQDASISGFLEWWDTEKNKRAVAAVTDPEAVQIMTIHKAKGLEFPIVIMPFAEWDMTPDFRDILWIKSPDKAPYNEFSFIPIHPSSKLKDTYFSAEYLEEELMSYLDNINLLYVAFTRPKYRLYILTREYTPKKNEANPYGQIYKLINQTIQRIPGRHNPDTGNFEIGTPTSYSEITRLDGEEETPDATKIELVPNQTPMTDWNESIRVRYHSNKFLNTDILTRSERISEGQLIHEALSFVVTKDDVDQAVNQMFFKGYIADEYRPALQKRLMTIVSHPEVKDWYTEAWDVRNEADIIGGNGQLLRPDRVMLQGDTAIVLDYKSGQANKRYHHQLKAYMEALKQMGYTEVEGYVYYTMLEQVERVQ